MQISVTARHMDITDAIRAYANEKVENALNEFPRIERVHVVLNVEKYRHFAEVFVQAKNHIRVEGQDESDDMYVSIDRAVEKVQRQLRRLRDKVQHHKSKERLAEVELEMQASRETQENEPQA